MKHSPIVTYPTRFGALSLAAFQESETSTHVALFNGTSEMDSAPLVRIQSACVTSTALGGLLCDCADQMGLALSMISRERGGIFIYLDDEGRGLGLFEKAVTMSAMARGADTVSAFTERGLTPDIRTYIAVPQILQILGVGAAIRLLTNNPAKVAVVERTGRRVQRVPIEIPPTDLTRAYLYAKKHKLSHMLTLID